MNLLIFQTGDFAEAYWRLQAGGAETFRDQRRTVEFVASLSAQFKVTTIAACNREYRDDIKQNLSSVGILRESAYERSYVSRFLNESHPDVIICRTPNYEVIRWAARNRVATLLSFADFFRKWNGNPKRLIRNLMLRKLFSLNVFPCVSNHSLNASLSVADALFLPTTRIVPWEHVPLTPEPRARTALSNPTRPKAFYAGALSLAKGVDDCLSAVRILRNRGIDLRFEFAGAGDLQKWYNRSLDLGVREYVEFTGLISNGEVRKRMMDSDVIVVPTHHEYAEGLPNVLCEALCSRTPVVISDHPAFASRLRDGTSCLVFRAADSESLANSINALLVDKAVYSRLSEYSASAHSSLYVGIEWTRLVDAFLTDPLNRSGWVEENSLAPLINKAAHGGLAPGVDI